MSDKHATLENRDGFQSKWGFILACIGSAVGMGNIWRFPIMVQQLGGMTFLIPYFLFVLLIGSTGIIEEFALGRWAQGGPVISFGKATEERTGNKRLGEAIGALPIVGSMMLAIGYTVVMSWIFKYCWMGISGSLYAMGTDMATIGGTFGGTAPEAETLGETLGMMFSNGIFGIGKFQAVAILCVVIGIIGGCYAIFGGLKAVAVSDTINGIGLIIGGLMIPFLALALLGHETTGGGLVEGVKYLVQTEPEKLNAWASWDAAEPALPWPLIFTGMFFNNLYWWCTNQSFVQRALAAKSLKEGQKGAIYCGFLKTIGFFYLVLPGVIAYHLPSIQDKLAAAGSSAIDFAYPALVSAVVPKPVMGFFAAVLFGAILSSFNSVLNSASTMFTLDLYRTAINPKASDMQCVKVGKIYGTCAGAVAICVAPFVMFAQGITTFLNSMSQFVSLPILFTVLGALIFRKAPKYAPKVITAVHVIAYGAFMILKPCYPPSGEPIHYLYAIAVLFVVEFAIMWYLNKYRGTEEYVPADVGAVDLTPWKYRHIVCIIGIILAIGIYILFSPIGIAA